ncbi:hypothetical protein ABZT06_35830 [Streptomyces sp. NPDC005483]|uniref:hypothetical protein n=1 Tax=Streptomyces sp. NPDC005483 TaxID=3154882 RepID=UPI0033AD63D0
MHEDRAPESVWRHSRWRGSVRRLWTSPWETDLRDKPLALWATDDAVVDVRVDRVRAFRIPDGAPVWTWRPPGEEVVAVASSDVRDGFGVVLHHDDGAAEAGRIGVTALDLATAEAAWSRAQRRDGLGLLTRRTGGTALAEGRIATVDGRTLRALDARTESRPGRARSRTNACRSCPSCSPSPSWYGRPPGAHAAGPGSAWPARTSCSRRRRGTRTSAGGSP